MPHRIKIFIADTPQELEEKTDHFLEQCSFVPLVAPVKCEGGKWYTTVTYAFFEGDNKDIPTDKERELYEMNNVLHLYQTTTDIKEIGDALGLETGQVNQYLLKARVVLPKKNGEG